MSKYQILKTYENILMHIEDVLGSKITNNLQLDNLGYNILPNYIGTFPSDKMPKVIKDDQCFILNTDSSRSKNKTGHWVAFYKYNKKLYYYDSFSRPVNQLSKHWLKKRMINANKNGRDQPMMAEDCGSRSLAYLITCYKFGIDKCMNVI